MTVNSGYQWIGSNTHVTIVGDCTNKQLSVANEPQGKNRGFVV